MSSTNIVSIADLRQHLAKGFQEQKSALPPPSSTRIKLINSAAGSGFELPDGSILESIEAVVLDWRMVNTLYTKRYQPGVIESPECWAISKDYETLAPDDSVAKPQSPQCDGCPKNEWGSAGNGSKGKACKNSLRLALITPDAGPKSPVYSLTLPPTSAGPFLKLVRGLTKPMQTVIIKMALSDKVTYPLVIAKLDGDAPESIAPLIIPMTEAAQEQLDRGFDYE